MTFPPFTLWVLITLWVVCGVLSAVLAKSKGRSIMGWLVLGFLLGVLGPVVVALLPSKPPIEAVLPRRPVPEPQLQEPRDVPPHHVPELISEDERDRKKVEEFAVYVLIALAALAAVGSVVLMR